MDNMNNNFNQTPAPQKGSAGLGVASMVLGILCFVLCWLPVPYLNLVMAIVAIILGAVAIKKNCGKGMGITGLVLGIVHVAIYLIVLIAGAAFLSSLGIELF